MTAGEGAGLIRGTVASGGTCGTCMCAYAAGRQRKQLELPLLLQLVRGGAVPGRVHHY